MHSSVNATSGPRSTSKTRSDSASLCSSASRRDAHAITQTIDAIDVDGGDAPPVPSSHGIWWLIGAAALIALGLYLLIHRGV